MSVSTHSVRPRGAGSWQFLTTVLAMLVTAPLLAAQYTLTVSDGSGSGSYEEGSTVHIAAFPPPYVAENQGRREPTDPLAPEQIFDRWSGDTASLKDPAASRTTLTMPAADISIGVSYKDTRRWMPSRVVSSFPPAHRGVIFLFHGTGGSASGGYTLPNSSSFIKEAVSRGLAVITIDSLDRVQTQWDLNPTPATNIDMQRVAAVRNQFLDEGRMSAADPVYFVGVSNGGAFASLWTDAVQTELDFPVAAAALYITSLDSSVVDTTTVPTLFALAENDTAAGGIINSAAMQSFDTLLSRGIPSQLWVNQPSPVYPERFWDIEGLTLDDSVIIYNNLKQAGYLDQNDFLTDNPVLSGWRQVVGDYGPYLPAIEWELKAAYAEHGFMSEFNDKTLDFLVNPTTIVENGPVVTGISPGSGHPLSIITITGENFYNVSEVRFNGVSTTEFTAFAGTAITLAVPLGATSGPVEVVNDVGSALSPFDFVVLGPEINSMEPTAGAVGSFTAISGTGFDNLVAVRFAGVQATEFSYTDSWTLWVKVPAGATTGPVEVETLDGTATTTSDFVVLSPPVIADISPGHGPVGTAVTISGSGLASANRLIFGGVEVADYQVDSDTQISVSVPSGAITAKVWVVTAGGYTSSPRYFFVTN